MRAVLISPNPSSNAGGVERFCVLLSSVLESAGWSTSLIGPSRTIRPRLARVGFGPSYQAISASRRARAAHADLVISNGFLGGPAASRRIHVFHGTMAEHVRHGVTGSRRYRLREAIGGALPEALAGRRATTVAVSASTAHELRRTYFQRTDAVIPNGVDTTVFSPGDRASARTRLGLQGDARYALFVGRFEYRKGADLVPQACRNAGYELLHAGAGAAVDAVALGTLAPPDLAHAYRAADCVVFPTRYEACSFVVLEALACGVPLITTSVGWMADFVRACPAYSRFVVRPELDSVSTTLRELGSHDDTALLAESRDYVERHNRLERFAEQWLALIAEVVAE
jgi:glycosyltransferase involved in cell wall biosynthesis